MKFQEVKVDGLAEELKRVATGLQIATDEKDIDELLANISQLQEHIVQLRKNSKDASEQAVTEKCAEELAQHFALCQSRKAAIIAGEESTTNDIEIACRIRPSKNGAEPSVMPVSRSQVSVKSGGSRGGRKTFDFTEAYGPGSTKEEVFELVKPKLVKVLEGGNACVCAYGQTGSGKSYTMIGTQDGAEEGIFQLGLDAIFSAAKNEVDYKIEVQIFEVYNESIGDLLSGEGKQIESGLKAERRSITSRKEGIEVLKEALENKASAIRSGKKNRSHRIISVHVTGVDKSTGEEKSGCLQLVDLSGSERVGRTEATVERLEEAKHINKSLSLLGDVLGALATKKSSVPFDANPLTEAMEPALSGSYGVVMIMHIAPEDCFRGESLTTLMYGQRVLMSMEGEEGKNRVFGARKAFSQMIQSDPTKEQRELQMRIAARSAMSEKENMEKDLKALRDELNLTRRSLRDLESRPFFRHSRTTSAVNPDMQREREGSDSSSRTGRSSTGLRTSRSSSAVSRGAVSDSMQRLSRRPRGIDRPYASRGRRLSIAFEEPETPGSIKHRPAEVSVV
ncbi:hypothetical protein BSKO_04973 [Bryopsis sp. KO-2023]|nr:hypothetical protein BSKO_04973 [Bryopsis sp. KO-2023]